MDTDLQKYENGRVYLPAAGIEGIPQEEGLRRYLEAEFPELTCKNNEAVTVFSVPQSFTERIEAQASEAEHVVFKRLAGLVKASRLRGLWMLYFHGASYAGHSYRNRRVGKLMIREHDYVIFVKYKGRFFVLLAEVKSTLDNSTICTSATIISDARVVKNNKRSAQHQLRDHLEVLTNHCALSPESSSNLQTYIMWPFLGGWTKDPKQCTMQRWKEDGDLHVFQDILKDQNIFELWFEKHVLGGRSMDEEVFVKLMNRFVILSCGVFVEEIHKDMLALLTQEQLKLLTSSSTRNVWNEECSGPLVVHGAAGTGKTLLVLKKLQLLNEQGELNEEKRALYICYWPGIRRDFKNKLEILGISKYVDTARFYISQTGFLHRNNSKYKHIFMDEAEAMCLSFEDTIMLSTLSAIYQRYHDGNCKTPNCIHTGKYYQTPKERLDIFQGHQNQTDSWGQLWFLVDINQASLFLPKHSPALLKIPSLILNRVMRSTGHIFNVFRPFYSNPIPLLPQPILQKMKLTNIKMGHGITGPPIYWVDSHDSSEDQSNKTLHTLVCVIIDLCATKGIKPNNICVIPFLANGTLTPQTVNDEISLHFVENGYKPNAVGDVEEFVSNAALNDFLIAWALRVKGLEFKVVILVLEDDDFDIIDAEDRKKMYIMASRCTCLLIVICPQKTRVIIDLNNVIQTYSFDLKF